MRHERGKIDAPEFKWVEGAAVEAAIRLQEDAGLAVVTDGEMRRLSSKASSRRLSRASATGILMRSCGVMGTGTCKAAVSEASEESDARVDVGRG